MIKPAYIGLALAGVLVMTGAAHTQVRGAPITKGVTTGDLSQQVDQTRQQTADLMLQLNQNASDIRTLNGRIEALSFELNQTRSANADLVKDNEALASELAQLEAQLAMQARAITAIQMVLGIEPEEMPVAAAPSSGGAQVNGRAMAGTGAANGAGTGQGPAVLVPGGALPAGSVGREGSLGTLPASQLPGEAGPLFALARQRLLQLDYTGAEEAFRSFIDKFGNDRQAGEAHFWLGEALHQQGAHAESGAAYTTMIRSFPDDERAPDALARLARAMRLIGDTQRACQALDQLPRRYPNASRTVRDMAAVERTRSGCPG
ncbi:tol-pal system protein YbgF [Hyphomonas sp.]|uniref:tol-pal system protein YbgF n=1 Tax=Hyphomonas sp. TaxID=87 RepID=UPI00391AA33B